MADQVWYAVRTNPRCEDRAAASIAAKGYETYAPVAKRIIVHHRTRVLLTKTFPLLVGYTLVDLPSIQHVGRVRSCDGVKGVLGVGGLPLALPTKEVQGIMDAEARMNEVFERQRLRLEHKDSPLRVGDKVTARRGAFTGFAATVLDARSRERVKVLMEIMGGMTEVVAPVDYFERAA